MLPRFLIALVTKIKKNLAGVDWGDTMYNFMPMPACAIAIPCRLTPSDSRAIQIVFLHVYGLIINHDCDLLCCRVECGFGFLFWLV